VPRSPACPSRSDQHWLPPDAVHALPPPVEDLSPCCPAADPCPDTSSSCHGRSRCSPVMRCSSSRSRSHLPGAASMGLVSTTRSRRNDLNDDNRARGSQPFGLRQWLAAVPPAVTSPRSMTPGREILCVYICLGGVYLRILVMYVHTYGELTSALGTHQLSAAGPLTLSRVLSLISATNELSCNLCTLSTLSASACP